MNLEDFWCEDLENLPDLPAPELPQIERIIEENPVQVIDHPPIVALNQVVSGVFLAFCVDGDEQPYYIGKTVLSDEDVITMNLCKVDDKHANVRIKKKLVYCDPADVLSYDFTLTKTDCLRKVTIKAIKRQLLIRNSDI